MYVDDNEECFVIFMACLMIILMMIKRGIISGDDLGKRKNEFVDDEEKNKYRCYLWIAR